MWGVIVVPGNQQPDLPHVGGSVCPKSVGRLCGGDTISNRGPPLEVTALLLRALEAFGYYVSLLSAKSAQRPTW